jgi:hypothetical protein
MNLFYNPSITDLNSLLNSETGLEKKYNVIVDNDGEVIIEPASQERPNKLTRYKFYFKGLRGKTSTGIIKARHLLYINQLFKSLYYCWENDIKGPVSFQQVSRLITVNRQ